MKKLLLDTDVAVDHLCGFVKAVQYVKDHSEEIRLSVITVAELYAGVKNDDECQKLDEFVGLFPCFPVTPQIAKAGGLYKRDYFKSHGIGLADGILAATAEIHGFELKTLNAENYPMLKRINPPYVKK